MIKHIVMWNVRGDSAQAKARGIDELKRGYEGLRGQVPGLLHLEIGVDSSSTLLRATRLCSTSPTIVTLRPARSPLPPAKCWRIVKASSSA